MREQQPIQQPINRQLELARRQPQAAAAAVDSDDIGIAVHREIQGAVVMDSRGRAALVVQETRGVVVGDGDQCVVAVQRELHVIGLDDSPPSQQRNRPAISGNTNVAYRRDADDSINYQQQQQRRQEPSLPSSTRVYYDDDDDDESKCNCVCCVKWTIISVICLPCMPFVICYKCYKWCKGDD